MSDKTEKKKSSRKKPVVFKDVSEKTLKKAAEIIDRQSKIGFYKFERPELIKKTGKTKIKKAYKVYIKIRRFSLDYDILFMKDHFGGYYSTYPFSDGSGSSFWLSFQQGRCVDLMKLVVPFLKVRRDAVEAILRYYVSKEMNNSRRLTDEVKQEREEIYKAYKTAQRNYFLSCQIEEEEDNDQ